MTRARDIRIDRLIIPASERHRAGAFRAAFERSLAAQLGEATDTVGPSTVPSHPAADRAARAVSARIGSQQS